MYVSTNDILQSNLKIILNINITDENKNEL